MWNYCAVVGNDNKTYMHERIPTEKLNCDVQNKVKEKKDVCIDTLAALE
jgi:hypothetical protein